jgi:hypothetical protein
MKGMNGNIRDEWCSKLLPDLQWLKTGKLRKHELDKISIATCYSAS